MTGAAVARGCAEFWALDEHEARRRLVLGRETMQKAGLSSRGFTPPGWLASGASVRAMAHLGFRYTTNHRGVIDLESGARIDAPALSHRPGGRGERIGERMMRSVTAWRSRRGLIVRVALHPADLARPHLRATTLTTITDAMAAGLRPHTYEEVVAPA
jgi:predicted deacetylase